MIERLYQLSLIDAEWRVREPRGFAWWAGPLAQHVWADPPTQRLKTLIFPALLVVDEIGYLPISRSGAMLLFQLMSRRYETGATILTNNKGFDEWGEVFGDDVMAGALIDRLVHHCHIVNIRGNSYRMRQHVELCSVLHRRGQPAEPAAAKGRRRAQEAVTS